MWAISLIIVVLIVLPVIFITAVLVIMGLGVAFRHHLPWNRFHRASEVRSSFARPLVTEAQIENTTSKPVMEAVPRRIRCAGELSWLLAPTVVAGTFAGISISEQKSSPGFDFIRSSQSQVDARPKPAIPAKMDPMSTDVRPVVASLTGLTQRPSWIDQLQTDDGITRRTVISSQQYTTQDEAEQELASTAADILLQDLRQLDPDTARHTSWRPTDESLKRIAIKRQYVEAIERDFGNFVHPMYRVWWQMELSPEIRMEFLPAWRSALTVSRIRQVGIVVSTIVLLMTLMTIYYRLNILTNGARRTQLKLLAGLVAVLWSLSVYSVTGNWL